MSSVSVIMVSYHTGPALWLGIKAALVDPECRELILVDNGNVPGVLARFQALVEQEPRFKLITGHGNVGFAKGCNMGARVATGDTLLLLNPDSMLPEGGLTRAVEVLQRYPENTLAGCYLINPDGSEQRGCRRAILTPENAVMESLGLKRGLNLDGTPMPKAAHEVPAISGAFMMLSCAFYTRLGGLDEGYFLHMEDMDFCMRVHKAKGKVICMPEVKVIHFRSTSEVASAIVERHKTRGFIRYINTHFSAQYSRAALKCLSAGIWLRYLLKLIVSTVDRAFVPPLDAKREVARLVLLHRLVRFAAQDDSLKGKTVLVAGASGQVGLCAVGKALARGARVIAIYHHTHIAFLHPNLEWVQHDLSKSWPDLKADALIYTPPLELLATRLAEILSGGITRVIAFGATSMFSNIGLRNTAELKSAEAQIVKTTAEKNGHVTILRPTMAYGVGLDNNITPLADAVRRFGALAVYGKANGRRHPVQAEDLAEAALGIIDNPATFGKAYNLGGRQIMTYMTMLILLFQYMGRQPRIFCPPCFPLLLNLLGKLYQLRHVHGDIARSMNEDMVFPIEDAINDFNYRPKGFLEGDAVV